MKLAVLDIADACGISLAMASSLQATINAVSVKWQLGEVLPMAHFLANCGHETRSFTTMRESFNYKDPRRIWAVFQKKFDWDKDRTPDPDELAFAAGFVGQPAKMASFVYENRFGNGNAASGDGHRYRGGGWTQLTFRDNYRKFGDLAGYDLVKHPEMIEDMTVAGHTAGAYYLHTPGLIQACRRRSVRDVRKLVNGGDNGLDDVEQRFEKAYKVLERAFTTRS